MRMRRSMPLADTPLLRAAWHEARESHSPKKFTEEYTALISPILATGRPPQQAQQTGGAQSSWQPRASMRMARV